MNVSMSYHLNGPSRVELHDNATSKEKRTIAANHVLYMVQWFQSASYDIKTSF